MAAARVTPRTLAPPEASGAARGGMRGGPPPHRGGAGAGSCGRPRRPHTPAERRRPPGLAARASAGGTSGYREEKPETWVLCTLS